MTKPEFNKEFNRLSDAYARSNDMATILLRKADIYYDALKSFGKEDFAFAVQDTVDNDHAFPTVAVLRQRCFAYRSDQKTRYPERPKDPSEPYYTPDELRKIRKENEYRKVAEDTIKKMTAAELAPYRQKAIAEIGFPDNKKINEVGELGIFWWIREAVRKEIMG